MRIPVIASVVLLTSAASAQTTGTAPRDHLLGQSVQCSAFSHDPDGSWVALQPVPIQRQNEFTQIATGVVIRPGDPKIVGLDVGAMLDAACPK